jgi:EpsI family protein
MPRKFYYIVALVMLIASGIGYRAIAKYLKVFEEMPVKLSRHLAEFPVQVGDWTGRDVPVPTGTLEVAHNEDYLYRLYTSSKNTDWVNLYIAYTTSPRNMLGHKPQKCYVGSGWVHEWTERTAVIINFGNTIPCLIHYFHWPAPSNESIVVLNYYVVNGRISNDEGIFTGLKWRIPNIRRDVPRYVAQIQISSSLESSVIKAAEETASLILGFLPDSNGKTVGTEFIDTDGSNNNIIVK